MENVGEIVSNKTITAIATAQGAGGIGVIRISGDNAISVADKVFKSISGKKISDINGYNALYGNVYDNNNQKLDECIALLFRNPHSYTGEDVVELSCHGGLVVIKNVLRAVLDSGAVLAEAGEFTKRAFLNGKMGLTEAEAVMDIISAKGNQSAKAAMACLEGKLRQRIDNVKEKLITSVAHLSAWADYPEEDIPEVTNDALTFSIKSGISELENLLSQYDKGKILKEGVDTVIAGKANVGKSTLMNLLSGCERSIVTNIPGTTRDIVEETIILNDIAINLSDTAGIRSTDDLVESIGVDKAKFKIKSGSLVLAVFDGSRKLDNDDTEILSILDKNNTIAIINKSDLNCIIDTDTIKKYINHIIYMSAKDGDGIERLEKEIANIVGTDKIDSSEGMLANERQRSYAQEALQYLKESLQAMEYGMTLDAVTISIEAAIQSLLELTGERVTEAVVSSVFAHFCVGK